MFGCKHIFGEIKDGYQYCTKCNKAVPVEPIKCSHSWETISHLESFTFGSMSSIIYVQKCNKCGEVKSIEISPEWRK